MKLWKTPYRDEHGRTKWYYEPPPTLDRPKARRVGFGVWRKWTVAEMVEHGHVGYLLWLLGRSNLCEKHPEIAAEARVAVIGVLVAAEAAYRQSIRGAA